MMSKMDDLISRQDAIRQICGTKCGCDPDECGLTMERDGTEHCVDIQLLLDLPSAQPEVLACGAGELNTQGWIPCEERLPEKSMWCLVTTKFGNIKMEYYRKAKPQQGGSYWRGSCKHPLAWMPLPEPYRGDE